jgi:hypothetical protein
MFSIFAMLHYLKIGTHMKHGYYGDYFKARQWSLLSRQPKLSHSEQRLQWEDLVCFYIMMDGKLKDSERLNARGYEIL